MTRIVGVNGLFQRSGNFCIAKLFFCCVGIVASAVLAINVVVNYQQKLADFLADLASESGQLAEPVTKAE